MGRIGDQQRERAVVGGAEVEHLARPIDHTLALAIEREATERCTAVVAEGGEDCRAVARPERMLRRRDIMRVTDRRAGDLAVERRGDRASRAAVQALDPEAADRVRAILLRQWIPGVGDL